MTIRADLEEAWVSPRPRSGGLKVAVVYPNRAEMGMSNLGYQVVLKAFLEDRRFDARRVFWERDSLLFPDGGRSLDDFDVIALSVSYQPDMVHLPRLLETGRVGHRGAGKRPLIIGGGIALTINPETSHSLFDVIVIGDAEPVLPLLMDELASAPDAESLFGRMAGKPGVYFPSWYDGPGAADGSLIRPQPLESRPAHVKMSIMPDLAACPARPAVLSWSSGFGKLYLLEVSRGCEAGCRFCAAGSICRPARFLPMDSFMKEADLGLRYRSTLGLVGTAVSYHPHLADMARYLLSRGGSFSPSSIRAERVTPELADLLVKAKHRTVSLAPEAGTERLRRSIGKGLSDEDFLQKADILLEAGIRNLKLYFMTGLPGESDRDAAGIVDLVLELRERMLRWGRPRGRMGSVTLSVNPFIPKPRTPFERAPIAAESVLAGRMDSLRSGLGPVGNVRVQTGSVRRAYLDALISLGDRSVADVLDKLPAGGVSLKRLAKILPAAERILFGREEGDLPWEFIK